MVQRNKYLIRFVLVIFSLAVCFLSSLQGVEEVKDPALPYGRPAVRKTGLPIPERNLPVITNPTSIGNLEDTRPSIITQAITIVSMAVLPFIIMLLTPFVKIVVVLSLLRTALGVQNSPPNMVLNGVSLLLTIFIMYPVMARMYEQAKPALEAENRPQTAFSVESTGYIVDVLMSVQEPLRDFLQKNSETDHQRLFYRMIYKGLPEQFRENLKPTDLIVVIPSFITGQLKQAFEIGVLIYIPFFVIDLVVSNILLAMGMMMLSPVTISMPLKLFLLVMLDGWTVLLEGLVKTFRLQ